MEGEKRLSSATNHRISPLPTQESCLDPQRQFGGALPSHIKQLCKMNLNGMHPSKISSTGAENQC